MPTDRKKWPPSGRNGRSPSGGISGPLRVGIAGRFRPENAPLVEDVPALRAIQETAPLLEDRAQGVVDRGVGRCCTTSGGAQLWACSLLMVQLGPFRLRVDGIE